MLTAKEILAINHVGDIFTNDREQIKAEYIKLCKLWHPDNNGNSEESNTVMAKINALHEKALEMIGNNKWESANSIRIHTKSKKIYEIKFKTFFKSELGLTYVGDNIIVYLIEDKFKDFYDNGIKTIKDFKFANDKMKSEISKYLPNILEEFETNENQYGVIIKKTPDLIILQDVLKFYNGNIPDRHVAWILSSLYNLACYMDYGNLSHNAITLSNYYISPKYHSGALLGGWWYTTKQGNKMIGVPSDIYNVLPPKTKENKLSSITTDLESIRSIGKQLLGEKNGSRIKYNTALPKPLIDWFLSGSSPKAIDEYSKWNTVLNNAYGKRTFVNMDLTADKIYKK